MSFTDAMVGIAKAVNAMNGRGRIERLCEQLRWPIDGREGGRITLNFHCSVAGKRPVFIRHGDEPLVLFAAYSLAILPPRCDIPEELTGALLVLNSELATGKWGMSTDDEGKIFFVLTYNALGNGLDAAALKFICEGMAKAASEFDRRMQKAGLL